MELSSLQSPAVAVSSSVPRGGLIEKPFVHGHVIKLRNTMSYPDGKKLKLLDFRAQASGTTNYSSEAIKAIPNDFDLKDEDLVFVAGATGRVGSRTVRELLKLGFRVRAGVRSVQRAESLVQSTQQMKLDEATSEKTQPIEKLEIVECDLEKRNQIGLALGNVSIVICCIGASEKEVFDITGPYRIDYQATKNLIDAATVAKVNHFILLTSLGTNKVGFPAAILNLFWGVLIWKRKAEEALLASGLPYTIVRPGGMERPTDSYKETHNITLSQEDTLFGGQVSNLQVAELMAFMAKNHKLSHCKVVEVIAETTALLTPMGELLARIPSQRVDVYTLKKDGNWSTKQVDILICDEDLKPPASPKPNPPAATDSKASETSSMTGGIAEPKSATTGQITRPLSPYTAYEDLKPPSSPSPTPSGPIKILSSASTPAEVTSQFTRGNDVANIKSTDVEKDPPQASTSGLSPYLAYEDLKPPTSPTPSPRKL